jgi:hypothetical protein
MKTIQEGNTSTDTNQTTLFLGGTFMKMYCVEHSKNDFENAYFTSETEAENLALMLRALMENGEIEEEEIYITVGEMTEDGDFSAEEVIK